MNDINKMPPVCAYCPYWEVCKPPYICASREDKKPKRTEKRTETHASDCISRQALCEYALNQKDKSITANDIMRFPSAQPECVKEFVMLKVIDLNGRPYYSIIYLENGNEFEGYSSYDLKVISEYLKRYFGFAQAETAERTAETAQNVSDGDLISRKAAMNRIDEALARVFVDSHGCGETALRGLPSVKLERKRGHWVGIDDEPCETWECDQCGYIQEFFDGDQPNYCANCGADMRGKTE